MGMHCRVISLCLLILGFCAGFTAAEDELSIPFEKYTLPNGLEVILHEDHSIPMISVNIWYHVGSKNERPGRTGFAHLFEHMMFQGTPNFEGEYFRPIQSVGGQVNGSTQQDRTNYWENLPSNYLELGLAMESDRMANLPDGMDIEKLNTQISVVQNERRQGYDNSPYGMAEEYITELIFPNEHPYSHTVIGSLEDLGNATLDDVVGFFRQYYTPNNASLCLAGDFDPQEAKDLINKYFATIPPGPEVARLTEWVPEINQVRRMEAEDDVQLPRLYMVWHTPAYYKPGDAEFDHISSVLTSGKNSRLFKSLVYEKQIAQDVTAYQRSHEISSVFYIVVTAKPGVSIDNVEKAVDEELKKLLTDGITEQELSNAKIAREAGQVRAMQSIGGFGGRADLLNGYNTYLGDPGKVQWDLDRWLNASTDDVMYYARKYLDLNRRGILHIVPRGELRKADYDVDRTKQPIAAAEPTFTPPKIQQTTLGNGMKLYLIEDTRLPLVVMNLILNVGWANDPLDKFGTAALTADLLNEGTKTRTALEISEEASRLGAFVGTGSIFDGTTVSLDVLKKNVDQGLDLLADIVLNPTFPEEELARAKKNYLARIQQESSQPFTIGFKTFMEIVYGHEHPYSQPYTGSGTEETINAISRGDLERFYRENYFPNNASIVIAGDISLSEAKKKIEKAFKDWKQGSAATVNLATPNPPEKTRIYIVDKPGAEQSMIVAGNIALPRNSPDYTIWSVLNRPLGGQFMSRINMNLREDKGYTYGARCFVWATRGSGPFIAYAPVQSQYTAESVTEFMKELRGITGSNPLTTDELQTSKDGLIKGFPQGFEDLGGLVGGMATMVQYDLPIDRWQTYVDRVNRVTGNEINTIADKYIHPNALTIVVVGDRAKIEQGLKDLNIGEVIAYQ
ncbi:MAG: pitrilysin family protein [Candidatus Zixiibacteriota bacterium]